MKYEWWRDTAQHVWRVYFAFAPDGKAPSTDVTMYIMSVCDDIYHSLPQTARDVLAVYYLSDRGQERTAVESYSARTGVPVAHLWAQFTSAHRLVMERLRILEKKG